MAALPKSFALLGLGFATFFLLLMGYMTHFTVEALALGTMATNSMSFPGVVKNLVGKTGAIVLELCLVLRCAGLMIVYVIVSADILAGHGHGHGHPEEGGSLPGLLCDWFHGGQGGGWCSDRRLAAGAASVFVLLPLVSFKNLSSTAVTSWLGLFSVGAWAVVTAVVAVVAEVKGEAHHMSWEPDWDALGDSAPKIATQMLAVIPILATAYTCQMTIHFVMREMRPFTQPRVAKTSAAAITICTVLFLVVAIGSYAIFGSAVPADVLENFTRSALAPLVGNALATVFYNLVRLGFLISILANFPMQMWPYRESLFRVCFGRNLEGPSFYIITYLSVALFYGVGMVSGSIWVPIQFVGATAGALIAFIFPAMVALRACGADHLAGSRSQLYWKVNAWALIVLGVIQAVAGLSAIFIKLPGKNSFQLFF